MANLRFVDLFSGCGGLSLGLSMAGAQGVFAVERDRMAFETFSANFIEGRRVPVQPFDWPEWLGEPRAWSIDELLKEHEERLLALRGTIDVVAGGPPCQGFSFAGLRREDDPRNQLFKKYIEVVKAIQPTAVILENVPGMIVPHRSTGLGGSRRGSRDVTGSYYERLAAELRSIGYDVDWGLIDAARFGVPQRRTRLIVIGLLRERCAGPRDQAVAEQVFRQLELDRPRHLKSLGLGEQVTARQAISDLSTKGRDFQECEDPASPAGFLELAFDGRRSRTRYQLLMRAGMGEHRMDSMRLARHREDVQWRFRQIIESCRSGVRLSDEDRARFGLLKHRTHPLAADVPAPTVTTLPDDIVHYSDPRILTVREYARLQSFPDWFVFRGKYTTGGHLRTKECPRYTQVGNAVPPLLALAIARALQTVIARIAIERHGLGSPPHGARRELAIA